MSEYREFKASLVATSYDPKTHSVKGIIVPHEVESGWVPIATMHSGNGFGILVGPNVGTAEKLDGDVFDLEFENGDPNTPIAKHKHFSATKAPPEVQSGEIMFRHEKGGFKLWKQDGSTTEVFSKGGSITVDADGHMTIDMADKNITMKTTGTFTQQTPTGNLA